jgi:hypothetical protein
MPNIEIWLPSRFREEVTPKIIDTSPQQKENEYLKI